MELGFKLQTRGDPTDNNHKDSDPVIVEATFSCQEIENLYAGGGTEINKVFKSLNY